MNTILIVAADGSNTPYEESQVRAMFSKGQIGPDTLYWKSGMAEWRPLRELIFSTQPSSVKETVIAQPNVSASYAFIKNPDVLTDFVKVMLILCCGVAMITFLANLGLMILILTGHLSHDIAIISDIVQGILAFSYLLIFNVTAVGFLKWIYRANLNCRGFGATGLKFTPGWSIGYYFVPIACLFYPYQIMKEIWCASTDPLNWEKQAGSPLLGFWWTLWIITCILGQIAFRLTFNASDTHSLSQTFVMIAYEFSKIILCILAFFVIKTIYDKQRRLVERIPVPQG